MAGKLPWNLAGKEPRNRGSRSVIDKAAARPTVNTMVNRSAVRLDPVFRALADPTRRRILAQVVRANCTVTELSRPFRISPPAISRHLRVLERAGLLRRVKDGKFHRFQLRPQPILQADGLLQRLAVAWERRLDRLETFLDAEIKAARQPT